MVNTDLPVTRPGIRCRQIERSDVGAIIDLLTRGFRVREKSHRRRMLSRLEAYSNPAEYPKYGYLLEHDGAPVGVILLFFAAIETSGEPNMRCYLSSWYVEPAFRSYASLLVSVAAKHKQVTYVNVSPDPHTWSTIEAQGFSSFCKGQFRAVPLLSLWSDNGHISDARAEERETTSPIALDRAILLTHARYGCLSLICKTAYGGYPFVFQVRRIGRGLLPCAQLIYCRDIADVARFARPLGVFLLKRGIFCIGIDSNRWIEGLVGKYFAGKAPKYFKGPHRPRPGDLAFTESVVLEP